MSGQPAPQKIEKRDHSERFRKFASTTVHHLREPVRTIGIYSEMLRTEAGAELADSSKATLDLIGRSADKLRSLLESLSEFAAVCSDDSQARADVPLDLVLRHAMQQVDAEAKAGNAQIITAPLPVVFGDFDHLLFVFRHLIRNAVQYRGKEAPEIAVEAKRAGDEWVLEVCDNGPGIAAEYRERIFEPYARLHGSDLPGNGLGLAVCRAVIGNHGGHIWVETSSSGGAAFRFTLPALP